MFQTENISKVVGGSGKSQSNEIKTKFNCFFIVHNVLVVIRKYKHTYCKCNMHVQHKRANEVVNHDNGNHTNVF